MTTNLASLMENRMHALYLHDDMHRLIRVNEPDTNQPTPRLAIMRSAEQVFWRVRSDVTDETTELLDSLVQSEPQTSDYKKPLKHQADYVRVLERHALVNNINSGPAYILPELSLTKNTVRITRDNAKLVAKHFPYTLEILDFRSPITVVVDDDTAVAVCFCARKTDTVAEAGVFTIEDYRRKGYAYSVVRDWSIAIRKLGIEPIYSTSFDNLASQSVAKKLGAIQFATDFSFI